MTVQRWSGGAASISQVNTLTVGGTPQLAAPSAPTVGNAATGGTVPAGTYQVEITYTNAAGETVGSSSSSTTTTGSTSTITITSPPTQGTGTGAASGWYAYVTQAGGSTYYRQQTAGSPTAIGTNLTLTANPTTTGANPPASNTAAGMVYNVTINGKTISYTSVTGDTNITVASNLLTNLTATTTPPEFQEQTWANPSNDVVTATAVIAGVPFVQTSSATGTGTLTTSTTTASSGPNDASIAANWSTGTLPASGDSIYLQNSSVSMLYGLSALAGITPALYQQDASFTGDVGLPYQNNNGYTEYRPRFLQVTGCTTINIGQGLGNGSGKTQLDLQSGDYTANVWNAASSSSETNVPCVVLKGGSSGTTVNVYKGSVGIALFAGETATVPALNLGYVSNVTGDAQVTVGAGCTLTTVTKTGGNLYSTAAVPTLTSYAGTTSILAGNMTAASLKRNSNGSSNVLNYEPAAGGTITTNTLESGCTLDCSGTLETVTLTNSTWYAGATVNAPAGNVTMSNAASIPDGQASDVNVNLGPGRTLLVV